MFNFVNPMAQATAGGVDALGRPQDAITAAQQALAAQALAGGPQQQGRPFAQTQIPPGMIPNASAFPTPPVQRAPLPLRASMVGAGGDSGGGGASGGPYPDQSVIARMRASRVPPAVAAYAYPQSAGGYAPKPPMPTAWPDSATPTGMPAPPVKSAADGGRTVTVKPHARQQAQVAAAAPQVPWITTDSRQNLPAGNGPLSRESQTQMGMLDLSKLFNRGG
jgi:hypothetical protein